MPAEAGQCPAVIIMRVNETRIRSDGALQYLDSFGQSLIFQEQHAHAGQRLGRQAIEDVDGPVRRQIERASLGL